MNDRETFEPPPGFKSVYARVARIPVSLPILSDMLGLVGYEASPAVLETWSVEQRVQAEVYAANVHLRASDNVLRKHPKPDWLPEPWQGPEGPDALFGASGTPLEARA